MRLSMYFFLVVDFIFKLQPLTPSTPPPLANSIPCPSRSSSTFLLLVILLFLFLFSLLKMCLFECHSLYAVSDSGHGRSGVAARMFRRGCWKSRVHGQVGPIFCLDVADSALILPIVNIGVLEMLQIVKCFDDFLGLFQGTNRKDSLLCFSPITP